MDKKTPDPANAEQNFGDSIIFYYSDNFRQVEILPCENSTYLKNVIKQTRDPTVELIKLSERKIRTQELEDLINSLGLDRVPIVMEYYGQIQEQQRDCVGFGKASEAIFYSYKDNLVQYIWLTGHWTLDKKKFSDLLHELGQRWDLLLQDDNLRVTIDLKDKNSITNYLLTYDVKKLSDIDDEVVLWRGTKIRMMLDNEDEDDDYYSTHFFDYMLISVPNDNDHMILVNVTSGNRKEGAVFVNKIKMTSKEIVTVNKKSLQKALGPYFEHCYLLSRLK